MKLFLRILAGTAALLLVLVLAAAAVVATMDKRALVAPIEAQIEKATGRDLTIGGSPRLDLSLAPTLVLEDVALANAPWGTGKAMLRAKRLEAQVALLPLLSRRVDLVRFTLVEPVILLETDRDGVPNWTFRAPAGGDGSAAASSAAAFALGEFSIERGDVTYRDGRTGAITAVRIDRLVLRGRDPQQPWVAQFKGRVGEVPLNLEGAVGPFAPQRDGPWPVEVKGEVAGRPAAVQAKVRVAPERTDVQDLAVALGATRLQGTLAFESRKGGRPLWRFDLKAPTLQAADLALAGAAASAAKPRPADGRVFPATAVSFDALRGTDAQGRLAIDALVLADGRKLGPASGAIALDGGRLVVDDLALAAYRGTLRGRVAIDAREAPAIALRLDGRQFEGAALLAAAGVPRPIQGAKTDVTVDVTTRGASPRAWAAGLNGTVTVRVGPGSLPPGNEGLAADLQTLLDALNPMRRAGPTDLVCGAARLPFRNGVARLDRGIGVETDRLGILASGTIDVAGETLDLTFQPRLRSNVPVDLARLAGAVRVRGPLRDPGVAVDPLGAVAAAGEVRSLLRGGAAALLGGVAGAAKSGQECATALGTAAPRPEPREPAGASPPGPPAPVEQALRRLFGR